MQQKQQQRQQQQQQPLAEGVPPCPMCGGYTGQLAHSHQGQTCAEAEPKQIRQGRERMVSDGVPNHSPSTSQQEEREKKAGSGARQMDAAKVQVVHKQNAAEKNRLQSVVAKVAELYAVPASPEIKSALASARSPLVEEVDVEFLAVRVHPRALPKSLFYHPILILQQH